MLIDQSNKSRHLSQSLVHPLTVDKREWGRTGKPIITEGLWVQHHFTPPNQVEHPPFNHHLLSLLLNDEPRQVSCFDGREYDAPRLKGEFFILPTEQPSAFHWENTDESVVFIIDPLFLQEVARENECLNPDQVELLPTLMGRDSTLETLALLFKQEMYRSGLGGRLFSESLANCFTTHLLRHHCAFEAYPREYKGGLSSYKLGLAIDYIQANLESKIELESNCSGTAYESVLLQ